MSTPVQNAAKIADLELYAPRRVREQQPEPEKTADDARPTLSVALDQVAAKVEDLRTAGVRREAPPTFWPEGAGLPPKVGDQSSAPSSPRMPQGLGGPNLEWSPSSFGQRHAPTPGLLPDPGLPHFEGDLAVKTMRQRLSRDPDAIPAPPVRRPSKSIWPPIGGIALVMVVAAIVAYGITTLSLSSGRLAPPKQDRVAQQKPMEQPRSQSLAKLVVERRQTFANEALALGVAISGATGGELALLSGLVEGTRLSMGGPYGATGWRLPARDLSSALAYAPRDFVGVMDASIDVRTPNDTLVDHQMLRLEWLAKMPAPAPQIVAQDDHVAAARRERTVAREEHVVPRAEQIEPRKEQIAARQDKLTPAVKAGSLDPQEIANLVKRGQEYFKNGDIASARLVLRRAANASHPQAALTLGATYDPQVLVELGVLGFAPDAAQARAWYQRAAELGVAEGARRVERLAQVGN